VLLAVDVGNTETKLGYFANGAGPERTWRVTTERRRTADEFGVLFSSLFRRAEIPLDVVDAIVISSVVPQLDRELAEAARIYYGITPTFFTAATQDLIAVRTDRPTELGSDLVAGAIAARAKVGAPAIVVAFGTATTYSVVGPDGDYLGAAIAPGIQISIDALVARTAKLPQVSLEAPETAIGRETVGALRSGIVYGFVGQTEGLIARLRAELGRSAPVVATGGLADVIASHTAAIDAVEPYLVLDGLRRYHAAFGKRSP
jgi:type III pantothenate kinase